MEQHRTHSCRKGPVAQHYAWEVRPRWRCSHGSFTLPAVPYSYTVYLFPVWDHLWIVLLLSAFLQSYLEGAAGSSEVCVLSALTGTVDSFPSVTPTYAHTSENQSPSCSTSNTQALGFSVSAVLMRTKWQLVLILMGISPMMNGAGHPFCTFTAFTGHSVIGMYVHI